MEETPETKSRLIISYMTLRKAIGILGTALPFMLLFGGWIFFQTDVQSSISSYYYTGMRDVFVGALFAIGFFLLSYKGYERADDNGGVLGFITDDIVGDFGFVFALGTALFPTASDCLATGSERVIGFIHLTFATLLFLTLIYFSLFLFTKTHPGKVAKGRKLKRNYIYKGCGFTMIFCIMAIFIISRFPCDPDSVLSSLDLVFWLEALMMVAFGFSWLTKGGAIWRDEIKAPKETS